VLAAVAAVSLAGAGAIGPAEPDARGTAAPLSPDLVTLGISDADLVVTAERGRRLLRFANEFANRGSGPLEIFPSPTSTNCDGDGDGANDRAASQRLFSDSNGTGGFERGTDNVAAELPVGCMRYHPAHDHWHVLDSAAYELRAEPRGRLATSRRKVGFCLGDNRLAFPAPFVPAAPVYPFGSLGRSRCDAAATQGLSVGHADIYALTVPGQHLRVDGLRRGRYCLVTRADPANLVAETDETNNARRTPISLRPRRMAVKKLTGSCAR
jgi:hypothetical protein